MDADFLSPAVLRQCRCFISKRPPARCSGTLRTWTEAVLDPHLQGRPTMRLRRPSGPASMGQHLLTPTRP